jgi:SAM-dependent methyltransferase
MPFRASFDCLWCGAPHRAARPDDLEGWAQLCPACLGRAGENPFLRFRLRAAMDERARSARPAPAVAGSTAVARPSAPAPAAVGQAPRPADPEAAELVAYYQARAPEYDDRYLRRGRYDRGPIATVAWQADLDEATRWLDGQPWAGRIVELAAGTGWWSPILASRGELWCFDAAPAPLELARDRLMAHGLRAHLHVRDAWAEPDGPADGLFTGFWLSHVRPERLPDFFGLARRWLRPGGRFAFIDSRPDPDSGPIGQAPPDPAGRSTRRLADGRTFRIPKLHHEPGPLAEALIEAGFVDVDVRTTSRFFVLGQATAGIDSAHPAR